MGRIGLVDDHQLMSLAVQTLVSGDDELVFVRHARTVGEMTAVSRDVDLVLLDLSLRDGSTPAANVAALQAWGAHVLVLTSGENPYLMREASRTPALGILRKSARETVLRDALRLAGRGEPVVTTEWAASIDADPLMDAAPLTAREREVLALYSIGLEARDVAAQLYVSVNTVNDHIKRIRSVYQMLGRPAGTKVELYQRGIEDGFVPAPSRD